MGTAYAQLAVLYPGPAETGPNKLQMWSLQPGLSAPAE